MSRRKMKREPSDPEPFRMVVKRGETTLLDRGMMLPRDPVGGLPLTRPLVHSIVARFNAPIPATAYALGKDEVVWRCGQGDRALWITFTAEESC